MGESKIKNTTAILMIGTALFFDFIQAVVGWVPVAGNVLADIFSFFIFFTFLLWFWMHGIKMMTPRRLMAMLGGGLIEMVPYINLLPAWTGVVIYLIGTTKIKELVEKHPTIAKGALIAGERIKKMNRKGSLPNVPGIDD